MKRLALFFAIVVAILVTSTPIWSQVLRDDGTFNLNVDKCAPNGCTQDMIAKLPGRNIVWWFPYDVRVRMSFISSTGKKYQLTGWLKTGEKFIAQILNARKIENGMIKFWCEGKFARTCGNPFEKPLRFSFEAPELVRERQIVNVQHLAVVETEVIKVRRDVYLDRDRFRDVTIRAELPEPAPRRSGLTIASENFRAGQRLEFRKSTWDRVVEFLGVAQYPIGMLLRKPDNIKITANGGNASNCNDITNNNNNSNSNSNANANNTVVNTGSGTAEGRSEADSESNSDAGNDITDNGSGGGDFGGNDFGR